MSRVVLRPAGWRDALCVWRWRNDPATCAVSCSTRKVGLVEHLRWFAHNRRDVVMGVMYGRTVATGRIEWSRGGFTPEDQYGEADKPLIGIATLSVNVAPEWRGRCIGTDFVALLTSYAYAKGTRLVRAEILTTNVVSRRAFARAGFLDIGGYSVSAGIAGIRQFVMMEHRR